jgi:D-cysteine desulfhydrase
VVTAAQTRSLDQVALFRQLPELAGAVPWVRLGDWPTPVEPLPDLRAVTGGPPIYVKREDRSSAIYGGNKVRTLEAMMGAARGAGATRIWATGAYGSNHSLATVLHARTAGLAAGMALFPQPRSTPAVENLRAALSTDPEIVTIASPLTLPLAMRALRRRGPSEFVMAPGGATPEGTFGAMSAALELAEQVARGDCPAPARIVLAVGSTCTTAGLLVGLNLAARLGVGFGAGGAPLPAVTAVRVTPWPVTSELAILQLAYRSARLVARLTGRPPIGWRDLRALLTVHRRDFGGGYGKVTARGWRAMQLFAGAGGPPLDVVYSGKSGAALIELARRGARGPLLFWATKSSAPLPEPTDAQVARAPAVMRRWLAG